MKRLTVFLCGLLMLASCEDIEDPCILPAEFSIGNVTDVSELTYDELENLVDYNDPVSQKEEMRRNGGLIIDGTVATENGESYNYAYLWYTTEESNLPSNNPYDWYKEGGDAGNLMRINDDVNNPLFFQPNQYLMDAEDASTYYYELELNAWNREYPGFVDDCLSDDFPSIAFSNVKKYTRPETPLIFEYTIEEGSAIFSNFHVESKYQISQSGICYSMTSQLPAMSDNVAYCQLNNNKYNSRFSVTASPREGGTYYVRAFATSEKGTAYSPVRKVAIY